MTGILLDNNYQLTIGKDGLTLGEITQQNQAIILQCHKGEIKENPAIGVGISDMLLDHDPLFWRTRIREALEINGQTVDEVRINTQSITIKASYY